MDEKTGLRERILRAAQDLANDIGPGRMSLDAVAARAGVSKGGLLYHFPSKAKLLEALVEGFLANAEKELATRESALKGQPNAVLRAYCDYYEQDWGLAKPPPSGLISALAENPDFLKPVRKFDRKFLDRIKADASDPTLSMLIFAAIQGMRCMELLSTDVFSNDEQRELIAYIGEIISKTNT